jgi:hypothetical protein
MPRETVHPSNPSSEHEPFVLTVGWHRDMDVQVGVECRDRGDGQHHLIDQVYGGELETIGRLLFEKLRAELPAAFLPLDFRDSGEEAHVMALVGRQVLDAVTGSTTFGTGVFVHPNRYQINQLILLLRKARDAAYGKDA